MKISRRSLLILATVFFVVVGTIVGIVSGMIIRNSKRDGKAVTGLLLAQTPSMAISGPASAVDLSPTVGMPTVSSSHNVVASTNVPTGYNLNLSATAMTGGVLGASSGSLASPAALADSTWGYALPRVSSATSDNTVTNNFDASYATPVPGTESRWANPTANTVIKNTQKSVATDTTTVYYAVKTANNTVAGDYSSTVQYTAIANMDEISAPTITSVTPNSGTAVGGTPIQIVGTGFATNDESVTTAVKIGGNDCGNVTISSDVPTVGQDTIYCTTPPNRAGGVGGSGDAAAGTVGVVVTNWTDTTTMNSGYSYVIPTPTITAPTAGQILNAGTTSTTLSVTTVVNAVCYWGTGASPATLMTTTGGTTHSQSITGLTNTSTNTRYVRCRAEDSTNSIYSTYSADRSVTFYVKAAVPTVTITAPTANQIFNAGTTTTTLTVTTNVASTCYWGAATNPTTAMTTTGGTSHSQSITGLANNSTNTRYVRCRASSGNTISDYSASVSRVFYVKAAVPTVTITAPTANQIFNAGTTTTTLTVTTNVASTCYWGAATNPTTAMTTTGGTSHSQSITGLANNSTNTRYVRCRASSGNTISDYSASVSRVFYVRAATPSAPTVSPASGTTVDTGTTTITVTSSGATCTWGIASGSYPYASGATRTTVSGVNTIYYSCVAGSGNTASVTLAGSWSYSGIVNLGVMQAVTNAACPTVRARAYDARNSQYYYVRKVGSLCWMESNLRYAGGGTNTYGDVKSFTLRTSGNPSYTAAEYMNPGGSTSYTNTDPYSGFYGYLYNWCAAMGGQATACQNTSGTQPSTTISVCPANWRLPSYAELQTLNSQVNSGLDNTSAGLRTNFLAVYAGEYGSYNNLGLISQGYGGTFWSSTVFNETGFTERALLWEYFSNSSNGAGAYKNTGAAVRCVR